MRLSTLAGAEITRDQTAPSCLESVERARIVVEAVGEKLQLLALDHGISVDGGVKLRALREVADMAGDAQRGFLMDAGDAIEAASAARSVGEPGIAGAENVIDGGADGLVRILIRRRIVECG